MKQKNQHAVALGKLGGKVGGKRRAEVLSAERRSEIASNAAKVRWQLWRQSNENLRSNK